jgi:small-conductance mechanosensitive channel
MRFWQEKILPVLLGIFDNMLAILPNVLAALVILLIGWLVAKALNSLAERLLKRIGFNRMAEKAGITGFIRNAGFVREPSWVVGKLIYWLLMLTFLLSAVETMKLTAVASTLQRFVSFIPNLIVVVLIVVFGSLFARFVGGLARGAAKEAGIDFADFLGKLVNNVIILMMVVIAFTQLEIKSGVLEITFAAILGAFGLAIALTLGMGSRSIAQNILSGVYARKSFHVGQQVHIRQMQGKITEIGTVSTVIHTSENKIITLPNSMLVDEIAVSTNGALAPATEPSPTKAS